MFFVFGWLACATVDEGKESGDTGDTGEPDTWPCADDEGQVVGVVTRDGGVSDRARLEARLDDETIEVDLDPADGSYSVCLAVGEWQLVAFAADCDDASMVDVVAGEVVEVNLDVDSGCSTADKPNLYLYPSRPTRTEVRVEVDRRQHIFASDPPYRDGWRGVALPDGRFVTADGPAPFLFYEVTLVRHQVAAMQREFGWCLQGEVPEVVGQMADLLGRYGFNAVEVDDFVEGWRIDLPPAAAYGVFPQLRVDHAAALDIQPPLPVDRLWLLVADVGDCDGALPAPPVVPFDRTGAHAVEWGVVLHDIVR